MRVTAVRFDDSLDTVLSADMSTPFGAQSAWRQLTDLIGRRRVPADAAALGRLAAIRGEVPVSIRAASARALAFANPPAELVRLLAEDDIAVAAPVLRMAQLDSAEWIALLPALSPRSRSVLRHRRDLAPEVCRALESFGVIDFVLTDGGGAAAEAPAADVPAQPVVEQPAQDAPAIDPAHVFSATPFVSIANVALGLPVVAEAMRLVEEQGGRAPTLDQVTGTFPIAELVARIDAYQRERALVPERSYSEEQRELFALERRRAESFRFETDAAGIVRWVEGAERTPLVGLSLDLATLSGGSRVDGIAAGAFRHRAGFADARLVVDGLSDAAGDWRISGVPAFDRASGRFTGYRGTARRPRVDETAEPIRTRSEPTADALRQLVHELRTPTNAIAGFAEMIESELLGPVPATYRDYAGTIRRQAGDLLTAIDDIDLAARLETHALDLRPGTVPIAPLLARIARDIAPLAELRGARLMIAPADADIAIAADDRAAERLLGRLVATLVAATARDERLAVSAMALDETLVQFVFDRPRALAAYSGEALLAIDAEVVAAEGADTEGVPLLGTGFALRLARNLAIELGGTLTIGETRLTLRLPAAVIEAVEQVKSH